MKKEPKVASTLSKGLSILENLAGSRKGKGVTELSKELGLTKSRTFRLLRTLTTPGYVQGLPDKSYAATPKTWRVGRASVENLNLRDLAAPELSFLSEADRRTNLPDPRIRRVGTWCRRDHRLRARSSES